MNRIEKVKSIINHLFQSIELRDALLIFAGVIFFDYIHLNPFFEWKEYELISQPSFFVRAFYSAFTYLTLGAALYFLRFYWILSKIVHFLGTHRDYIKIKDIIWKSLLLISFVYIVPKFIDIANFILSGLINSSRFVIYVSPHLGIAIITATFIGVIRKRYSEKSVG